MRRLQAVLDRQQAVGEALRRRTCGPWTFPLGAAAGVLGLGLGAQVGVGRPRRAWPAVGELGLDGRRRAVAGCRGAVGCSVVVVGVFGRFGSWCRDGGSAKELGRVPVFSRGASRSGRRKTGHAARVDIVGAGAPAVPVGQLAAVAFGRPALLEGVGRLDAVAPGVGGALRGPRCCRRFPHRAPARPAPDRACCSARRRRRVRSTGPCRSTTRSPGFSSRDAFADLAVDADAAARRSRRPRARGS